MHNNYHRGFDGLDNVSFEADSELSSGQLAKAVRNNLIYGHRLGWMSRYTEITRYLGFSDHLPGPVKLAQTVARWQARNGLSSDGILGPASWRKMQTLLDSHSSPSATDAPHPLSMVNTRLPNSSNYLRRHPDRAYGVPEVIRAIQWIGREWHTHHPHIVMVVGDISKHGGGRITGHVSHRIGLDVDIHLEVEGKRIHKAHPQTIRYRPQVQVFVNILRLNPIMPTKFIFYNDLSVRGVRWQRNHNNHLHVRFCMPGVYRSQIDLGRLHADREKIPRYNCR